MDQVTKVYRLQKWAEAIQDRAASGLTVNEWCELHSVGRSQYYYRLKLVREAAAKQMALTPACTPDTHTVFAEIPMEALKESHPQQTQQMLLATACIRSGNAEILVTNDASEELLSRILKAVRSC